MPVAVQQPNVRQVQEKDPLDTILKGLDIATKVYGIKTDYDKSGLLAKELISKKEQQEFSNQADLAGKGLMKDDSGKLVDDPNSSFYKQRMKKGEVDPLLQMIRMQKAQELSLPQAKQLGLYESGSLAEKQYQAATGDKEEYDPTSKWQAFNQSRFMPDIAKGAKPLAAEKAQSAWVEAFLRDASGAAIPESERGPYKTQFFPQAGDTPEVVANKQALREQKMQNALTAAGGKAQAKVAAQPKTVGTLPSGKPILSPEEAQKRLIEMQGLSSGINKRK